MFEIALSLRNERVEEEFHMKIECIEIFILLSKLNDIQYEKTWL